MLYGSIMAILQKNLKRMIAYSSVAQIGYIFFGIGLGNELGLTAAVFHIITHALTKSALFLIAGNVIEKINSREISQMKGIGIEMPVSFAIFTICGLSMVGIPLLAGFSSKWSFALAIIDSERIYLIILLLASSLLNALYYLPIIINAYFGEENLQDKLFKSKEKPVAQLLPAMALALVIIYFGINSGRILEFISLSINSI
jgi:multicomponent Na+:H+ antiporter subunit D